MHKQKIDQTMAYLQYSPLGEMSRVRCFSLLNPHDYFEFPPRHGEAHHMEPSKTRELFALLHMQHRRKRAADKKQQVEEEGTEVSAIGLVPMPTTLC